MNIMEYVVDFTWDEEASVWVATSDDIPGLVLEGGSFDALVERVKVAAAELLAINNQSFSICFRSEKHQKVYA
jgi:predicted RNase H-like HicB family nuclease